jgi:FG-GAP repeat
MNGTQVSQTGLLGNVAPTWNVISTGDYNGDGKSDLLWQDTGGDTVVWFLNGFAVSSTALIGTISPSVWTVQTANAN